MDHTEEALPLDFVLQARAAAADAGRGEAVHRHHAPGSLTARERIAHLLDVDTFVEYGMLAQPADNKLSGPADGVITGIGRMQERPVVVVSYDYTVLAGSQGHISHLKVDRLFEIALEHDWPVVIFSEGGGARAQELGVGYGRSTTTFVTLAALSGRVPVVGAVLGPAFAGHANLAGLCDFTVATSGAAMGMSGPPLVEAAMGVRLTPEEIGPVDMHAAAGAVDYVAENDSSAIDSLVRYLSYFGGRALPGSPGASAEQVRDVVPLDRRRAYDVCKVVAAITDADSTFELRRAFARNVVTALARIDGWPVGVIANQPMSMAGAIDTAGSDKIARFIHLCDAFGVPLLYLVDTPGFMVGPAVEKTALVRHSARTIHALAHAQVPVLTVVLRKAYGLGYYAMGSPAFQPAAVLAWPTAEFGGMGLEGAANILSRDDDPDGVRSRAEHVQRLRDQHSPIAVAAKFALDDVIDPADTHGLLSRLLAVLGPDLTPSRRPIDPW